MLVLPSAWSQGPGTVTVDVEHCFALESPAAQRECFANEVNRAVEQQGSADESLAPRQAIEQRSAESSAGSRPLEPEPVQRGDEADRRSADTDRRSDEAEETEYFGTIVEMRERLPSSYVIRLDNGQIWEQTEPKQYPLRPGLEVRIYPTRWGSRYRLTGIETGGHIQVRRVQ